MRVLLMVIRLTRSRGAPRGVRFRAGSHRRCARDSAARVTRNRCPQSRIVEPRVGDQPLHDAGVDRRDERIVGAGHDQRRLAQRAEPRQAGPAERRGELQVVPALARKADVAKRSRNELRDRGGTRRRRSSPATRARARDRRSAAASIILQQHRRAARDHQRARCRRREDQPAAARAMLERELLRDRAAPRHAEHVGLRVAEMIEQRSGESRDARWADRATAASAIRPRPGTSKMTIGRASAARR